MYEFVYFKLMLIAFVPWLILFLLNKAQRKEMLVVGGLSAIAVPIQELWYTKDYWHPTYVGQWPWIEDMLFGFAVVGVAVVIYEIVLASWFREEEVADSHPFVGISLLLVAAVGMGVFAPIVNSIYAAVLSFIIVWLVILFLRRDLFIPSLGGAVLVLVLMFIGYKITLFFYPGIIYAWWKLENISGILISGIPLEEYMWFFAMGLAFGPLYEFGRGIKFLNTKNN